MEQMRTDRRGRDSEELQNERQKNETGSEIQAAKQPSSTHALVRPHTHKQPSHWKNANKQQDGSKGRERERKERGFDEATDGDTWETPKRSDERAHTGTCATNTSNQDHQAGVYGAWGKGGLMVHGGKEPPLADSLFVSCW